MKTLASHVFKNDKEIRVEYLTRIERHKQKVPMGDTMALTFRNGEKATRMHIRPDEAVIIIQLLSEGLYKSVRAYREGLLRKQ